MKAWYLWCDQKDYEQPRLASLYRNAAGSSNHKCKLFSMLVAMCFVFNGSIASRGLTRAMTYLQRNMKSGVNN